jgi:hypothetical protein
MTYCLSCLKIQAPQDVVKIRNTKIEKKYCPIKQPHICCDCFDFLLKIIPSSSNSIDIVGEIIDLCLIREKFSVLLMGFKYDDMAIMHDSNLDVLYYIMYMYCKSVKILTQFK